MRLKRKVDLKTAVAKKLYNNLPKEHPLETQGKKRWLAGSGHASGFLRAGPFFPVNYGLNGKAGKEP